MTRVLVIAELDGEALSPTTACTVRCASEIAADPVDVAVLAVHGEKAASEAAALDGVSRVLLLDDPAFAGGLAEALAPQIRDLAADYSHLLTSGTASGRDVLPRVAALLGVGQISDIMAVDGPYRFRRPAYAGNAIVTLSADPARRLLGTVRTASWLPVDSHGQATVVRVDKTAASPGYSQFMGLRSGNHGRHALANSPRVVCAGRGIRDAEGLALVQALADALNAALGASRAVVDAGLVANELQIGQTGKIIAPDLYIATGISGAIQHLTGIRDAGTIVAINSDPDAPIMQMADISLVADLFQAIPELLEQLAAD